MQLDLRIRSIEREREKMRSVLSLEQNIDKSSLSMLQSMVIKDKHTMLFILFLILTQIEQTGRRYFCYFEREGR